MIQQYLHKKQIRASNRFCWNTRICFILPWCNPKRCTSDWNGSAAGKVPDAWEGKSSSSRVGIFRKRPYSFGILRGECRLLVPKIQDPYRLGAGVMRQFWNEKICTDASTKSQLIYWKTEKLYYLLQYSKWLLRYNKEIAFRL